jgi:hypothetical protein
MQITSNHKRRLRQALVALVGGSLSILGAGCAVDSEPNAEVFETLRTVKLDHGTSACRPLVAGQHHVVGTVCLSIEHGVDTSAQCGHASTGRLNVTYQTHSGWKLYEKHMHAGDHPGDIPKNPAGNPKIGHFEYHHDAPQGHTQHTFSVPLCRFGLDDADEACDAVTAYIAAHATVKKYHDDGSCQAETAWGEGPHHFAHGWSMFFDHVLGCEGHAPHEPHEPC